MTGENKKGLEFHCRSCGVEISLEQFVENDGLCDQCSWDDEDCDLFLGGGW